MLKGLGLRESKVCRVRTYVSALVGKSRNLKNKRKWNFDFRDRLSSRVWSALAHIHCLEENVLKHD